MPEASQPRLVGRETELRRLLALLDDAAAGRPVVALVSGDAGIDHLSIDTVPSLQAQTLNYILQAASAVPREPVSRP